MSLYKLLSLPSDIVYYILQVGQLSDQACRKCNKWQYVVRCRLCNKAVCQQCCASFCYNGTRSMECCYFCEECGIKNTCKRGCEECGFIGHKRGRDPDPECEDDLQQRNFAPCAIDDKDCKRCCRQRCSKCKKEFCCEHVTCHFAVVKCYEHQTYNLCIQCWIEVRDEINRTFAKRFSCHYAALLHE